MNRLVHELYFPKELNATGLRLFDLVEAVERLTKPLPSGLQGQAGPTTSTTLRQKSLLLGNRQE